MKIIDATKDNAAWWVLKDDGTIQRIRHSLESAIESPISYNEDLICALLEKLYPPSTTGG